MQLEDINDKEYGLVLEGGGAKGSYQIGAWKALRELGINIKGVVGTSVGALNGALIVQDEFETAYDLWSNIKYSSVIDWEDEVIEKLFKLKFNKKDFKIILSKIIQVITDNGLDITPLKEIISDIVDEDKIRDSDKIYGLVTVSLSDMKSIEIFLKDIPKGLLHEYLLASSYLPVFKKEKLHGKIYIDGGFYNNVPIKMLVNKGFNNIILVRLHAPGINRRERISDDVELITISTRESLGGVLEFSKEQSNLNISLGYYDTMRVFNNYRGHKYYIKLDEKTDDYYLDRLIHIPQDIKKDAIDALGDKTISDTRNIVENIIPKISRKLNLDKGWDYADLVISMLEFTANKYGVERFKLYTLQEFKDNIEAQISNADCKHQESKHNLLELIFDNKIEDIIEQISLCLDFT